MPATSDVLLGYAKAVTHPPDEVDPLDPPLELPLRPEPELPLALDPPLEEPELPLEPDLPLPLLLTHGLPNCQANQGGRQRSVCGRH